MDLNDIEDDQVSDVSESDIDKAYLDAIDFKIAQQKVKSKDTNAQLIENYEAMNLDFMKKFIKLYSIDPASAKALYYKTKVHFDIQTPEGSQEK